MTKLFSWLFVNLVANVTANIAKLLLVAGLAIPALVATHAGMADRAENRQMAPWPARPHGWQAWLKLPGQIDIWINDHFGFRADLVALNNRLRFFAFHEFPTIQMAAGRNGRVFVAAHGLDKAPFSALTSVCGADVKPRAAGVDPETVAYLNQLFQDFHRGGMRPRLLIVPSSPVIYSEDVPRWLEARCAAAVTPVTRLLEAPALDAATRAEIWYPLAPMREIKRHADLFPTHWFHWSGQGLGAMAQQSVQHFWGIDPGQFMPLAVRVTSEQSDVAGLFPGVNLMSAVAVPDLAAAGIKACIGGACFPEIAPLAAKLIDVSRFVNPAAPPRRLLIISDSFGSKIAPWLSPYFRSVEHVSTNYIKQLQPVELEQLRQFLFRQKAATDVLFLYHDGSVITGSMQTYLQPLQPVPAAP